MVRVKERVLVTRKDGVQQHYNKWVYYDDELDEYRIVEWTFNFIPTKKSNRPSDNRDWEVRIQAPEDTPKGRIRQYAEDALTEEMSDEGGYAMVESSTVYSKIGVDFVETSDKEYVRYKIIDKVRPQFRYPKRGWGDLNE